MSHKPVHITWVFLIFALSWISCDRSVVFEQNQSVPASGWAEGTSLTFTKEMTDTLALHQMFLNVRNTSQYPYRNLYLFLDIEFPGGTILRDTIECILADKAGQWTGKGFGDIKSNRFLFRDQVWFPEQGTYTFTLQHAMREESLEGISDMGIRIERK